MDIVEQTRRRVAGAECPDGWRRHPALAGLTPSSVGHRFEARMSDDRSAADAVVRSLIELAQEGCEVAPLVLVSTLGSGIRRLARDVVSPDPVGEVVGEFVEVVYGLRVDRYRRSLAAALLLTTRRRIGRRRAREVRWDGWMTADPVAEIPDLTWAGDELLDLLSTIGLAPADVALIVATRVLDVPVEDLAQLRGVTPAAVYQARRRLEKRLPERLEAVHAA